MTPQSSRPRRSPQPGRPPRPRTRPDVDAPDGAGPRARTRGHDERGDYALFIAVIATAMIVFGSIAYDAPRLNAARHDTLHFANEAARVAAVTIASGGTIAQAEQAALDRLSKNNLIYGEPVIPDPDFLECVGNRVQVTVWSRYRFRSALSLARAGQDIRAQAGAEAYLSLPSGQESPLTYAGECPLI